MVKIKQTAGGKLSAVQQRFNRLMSRTRNLNVHLRQLDQLEQHNLGAHTQAMTVYEVQADEIKVSMALQLHQHLQQSKLTAAEKRDLRQIVKNPLQQTAHLQRPELMAVHDQYHNAAERAQAQEDEESQMLDQLRDMLKDLMEPQDFADLPDDIEALMAVFQKKVRQMSPDEAAAFAQAQEAKSTDGEDDTGQEHHARVRPEKPARMLLPHKRHTTSCRWMPNPPSKPCFDNSAVPCTLTERPTPRRASAKPC